MSCNNCNQNNSIPLPPNITNPCNPCVSPCTDCGDCPDCTCVEPEYLTDGCYFTQPTSCIVYNAGNMPCLNVTDESTLNQVLQALYTYSRDTLRRLTSDDTIMVSYMDPDPDGCADGVLLSVIPSNNANNALTIGTDGRLFVQALQSPVLTANDSDTIDFTTSGTQSHTLTASVKLNATNNLIQSTPTGLLVDSTALSPALTFRNGLTKASNIVELGGTLRIDTTIDLDQYEFTLISTNGLTSFSQGTYLNYVNSSSDIFVEKVTTDKISFFTADFADYLSNSSYYTNSFLNLGLTNLKLGFYLPAGASAPSNNSELNAYSEYLERTVNHVAPHVITTSPDNVVNSSGTLVSGKRYKILTDTGGANFGGSGASSNTAGTIFTANGTQPVWGSGTVKLLGNISHITKNVLNIQEDDTYLTVAVNGNSGGALNSIFYQSPSLFVQEVSLYTDRNSGIGYLAKTQVTNSDSLARIGFNVPTSNEAGIPVAATDPVTSSYYTFESGKAKLYSAAHELSGTMIIRAISDTSSTVSSNAAFEIKHSSKGFLIPRLSQAARLGIISPEDGLMVYQTDNTKGLYIYDSTGAVWRKASWV